MIDDALRLITLKLNEHLGVGDLVTVSNLFYANGEHIENRVNKLVMFVANIALDDISQKARGTKIGEPVKGAYSDPLYIDLDIMLVSNFYGSDYALGLQSLSKAIQFFHGTPKFSKTNTANFPPSLQRITIEMAADEDLEKPEPWKYLSPVHKPFVLYKLKLFAT